MGFSIDNLYHYIEKEFLPHEEVKAGEGLTVVINQDLLTLDYLRGFEKFYADWKAGQTEKADQMRETAEKIKSLTDSADWKSLSESKREQRLSETLGSQSDIEGLVSETFRFDIESKAIYLGGVPGEADPKKRMIVSWNLERGGQPVPVSFEEICKFSQALINKLYAFCNDEAARVEKKTAMPSADTSSV